jgi:hypothetical protein
VGPWPPSAQVHAGLRHFPPPPCRGIGFLWVLGFFAGSGVNEITLFSPMKTLLGIIALLLVGCATSPELTLQDWHDLIAIKAEQRGVHLTDEQIWERAYLASRIYERERQQEALQNVAAGIGRFGQGYAEASQQYAPPAPPTIPVQQHGTMTVFTPGVGPSFINY